MACVCVGVGVCVGVCVCVTPVCDLAVDDMIPFWGYITIMAKIPA